MFRAAILLALISSTAVASPVDQWLGPPPQSAVPSHDWTSISRESFFEIPVSKLATAEAWLAKNEVVDQADASYFGHAEFRCALPSKLYLVRALYGNGGTGGFELKWAGSALIVLHESLGKAAVPSKSALMACLPKRPVAVYAVVGGAL
jgi:hypothetical protein